MQASTTANVGVPGSSPGLAIHERPANVGVPARRIVGRRISPDAPTGPFGPFSALGRAHAAATHVGPGVRERRAIVGSFRGLGPPRWRADPPPPARRPGRATIGWRIGPPAGGARATRRRGPRQARRRCPHPSRARAGARRAAARGRGVGLVGAGRTPTPWSGDPAASAPALTIAPRFRSDRATLSLTEIVGAPGSHHSLDDGRGCPRPPSVPDGYSAG